LHYREAAATCVCIAVLLSACAPRENRTTDTPAAKGATPVAKIDTAPAPVAPAGSAGDRWSVPAKAKSDDELAAADTFDLIAVGAGDEDGGYRLTADSIEFLRFDDGHGHRTAAGRIVRDTLEVRRGARLEHYVRVGRGARATHA
jgi:hypothetical protein